MNLDRVLFYDRVLFTFALMNILQPEIQDFINQHIGSDIQKLSLQKNPFSELDYKVILNQIEAKTKSKTKLPTWFNCENIIFPNKISVEQTSSEATANYKSKLISGKNIIDLTGGFGVDCYYFSKVFEHVIHCEINSELSEIVKHNFKALKIDNITCYAKDGLEVLKELDQKFDWIYIDPSRRDSVKGKVFLLQDCQPDITTLLEEHLHYSDKILVKASPIYDISVGISELKFIKNIHIVSLDNEVKEVLFEIHKPSKSENNISSPISIKTINITSTQVEAFNFILNEEVSATYCEPQKYLYQPNASVMKSQGFDQISKEFKINKLHKHSHLYTSNQLIDFVGRTFEIKRVIPYKKSQMKTFLQHQKANITTRNFPETVTQIRQKWKITDGGSLYCFFTTDIKNEKIVVICEKI